MGGGRMGAGIAHAFLLAGSRVTVVERDDGPADAATARIRESLARSVQRGSTSFSLDELERAFESSTGMGALTSFDLVVEAVPDRGLKLDALTRVEAFLLDTAVLASNTSISIDDLAGELRRPGRFLGMHFFNPVPSSALVEIVAGAVTEPGLIDDVRSWVAAIGKTPVVVRDVPGFASSRLGVVLGLEAIRVLEEGVAPPRTSMRRWSWDTGIPWARCGRRTSSDSMSASTSRRELHAKLGERFSPPALLRRLVADGHLGRKTGRGFYEWTS
jgi:3-hydroxybutyryl-CoA dehydrogenase